jgi:Xaa-Pro aminopeptidase
MPSQGPSGYWSPGRSYLVDPGAKYEDGATDVTRTIAIGEPTPVMREHFTRRPIW